MKRGLTILTAALFAGALALPAMAQDTGNGAGGQAPAASAAAANAPSAGDSATVTGSPKMEPAATDSAQPQNDEDKSAGNTASDAGNAPAATAPAENKVE